jgi:hypothetical protein
MNWAWASSLDQIWNLPTVPMWITLAAAGFFGLVVLITLLRAEKSVANGTLTVITLLAIGVAVVATVRGYGPPGAHGRGGSGETRSSPQVSYAALPALSCIDDLAGDTVLSACEKVLFGSAESTASAVAYTASQITRLTTLGDATVANKNMTPELQALRRALERDRYGLVAQVLLVRDRCTPMQCAAFRSFTDQHRIASNMEEHTYDGVIARYSPTWNAPPAAVGPLAVLAPTTMATGKPTTAEFPTAASTPPVSIMTPEPGTATTATASRSATPAANASVLSPRPPAVANAQAAAKKPPAPKPQRTPAPVQIAPAAPAASAPAASND